MTPRTASAQPADTAAGPSPAPVYDGRPEADVLAAARRGDEAAVRVLVRAHQGRLWQVARRITGDDHLATDRVQEAFVKAFERLDRFREDARFGTWLHRICVNACLSGLRGKARQRDRRALSLDVPPPGAPDAAGWDLPTDDPSPDRQARREEERTAVRRAVAELPEEQRMLVVLVDLEERSYEEAAEETGLPVGTVKSRLHRARTALRETLERRLEGPESP